MTTSPSLQSRAVRAGVATDPAFGAVMPPVYLSTNFTFPAIHTAPAYDYTRSGNPTRDHLRDLLADLEGGAGCAVTSSGMSAIHLTLQLLGPADLLVVNHDCYGGLHRLVQASAKKGAFQALFVDLGDTESVSAAMDRGPAMVWIETPSNPLLRVYDISGISDRARACGAVVVTDNTFLSPALQRPIDLGSDIVVHSTTKFVNGHSDVVGGAVVSANKDLAEELDWWANCLGLSQSPWDSYLTLRGARTLDARVRVHQSNAEVVAQYLDDDPRVARVWYPGLTDDPGHALAARQQAGWGSLLSFELQGGSESVGTFVDGLRFFSLAESLGGVESLICHPATMTHAAMDETARVEAGIGEGLLRISVGLESCEDLLGDLGRALDRTEAVACIGI